jgi:large subunit ribosomal protein L25
MMNSNALKVTLRHKSGKKEARRLRHDRLVPGVVYGCGEESVCVSMDSKELGKVCYSSSFFSRIININLSGKTEQMLPRTVDFHPVSDEPIHVDFQRVSKYSKIKSLIAIEFVNEDKSPGMKRGGVLNVVVHQLECMCSADSIPEKFTFDLTGKEIGESILLSDVHLPDNVVPLNHGEDIVIATIVGARTGQDEENEKPGETAAG